MNYGRRLAEYEQQIAAGFRALADRPDLCLRLQQAGFAAKSKRPTPCNARERFWLRVQQQRAMTAELQRWLDEAQDDDEREARHRAFRARAVAMGAWPAEESVA